MKTWLLLVIMTVALIPTCCRAAESKIVLRDYINQPWTNELLTYPFSAPKGACDARSVTLTGPRGAVPVQLSDITYWPETRWVKSAKLSFIADLAPLAADTYTVRIDKKPAAPGSASDLTVTPGNGQVEITTKGVGARLLLGAQTYPHAVSSDEVPGPVVGLRLVDGTWFGGSRMYGPGKLKAYSATLTDCGPVFARVAVRYTYEGGNTLDLAMRVAAGDNTVRMETRVAKDQPKDGFNLVLSRGLPPLIFQVQDELTKDRECFMNSKPLPPLVWADIPLNNYVAPKDGTFWTPIRVAKVHGELVTTLSPWEDWFGTFSQTRIRIKLEHTERELQIRSLDPGAWVAPRAIESVFDPTLDSDPQKGLWVDWGQKCLPLLREPSGEIVLQVNAAQGVRKWTVSDCRSLPGVAALYAFYGYKPENDFPPETRPTVGDRLDTVKDYVLEWPHDAGKHPRLFISRAELEARWKRRDANPATVQELLENGSAPSPDKLPYTPNWGYDSALGAYLLGEGAPEIAAKTQLLARLRQTLQYDLWGCQFGKAGSTTPIYYDALIDSPVVPAAERSVLRARMAYYAYRLADPAVWSAERGYASGNQNMTVTWEISRGITACAIPEHPMAKTWYRKAQRIMEYFLDHMVGPAGEWPEAMSHHGRTSVDMLLSFAIASTNSGFRDYVHDPRMQRLIVNWAKMLTPRDPRPRGQVSFAASHRRYYPAMGRDSTSIPGGTTGALARMLRASDPALSSDLQWAWLEEGGVERINHLGGFSFVSCDKSVPSRMPAWTSEVFPYFGAMLRHGLGTPDEHQVLLYSGDHFAAFHTSHTGSFSGIFAYGIPVAGSFAGSYEYQEGFLTCTVDLARGLGTLEERKAVAGYVGTAQNANMWGWPEGETAQFGEHGGLANVRSFSTLPRQDYVAVDVALHYPRRRMLSWKTDLPAWPPVPAKGKPPVDWRRQALFLKDDDPAMANYLLIRDSISGGQPTMWQMWTVSETVDMPEKVKDVAAVLATKPGHKIFPARELQGNRFTAIGQLGVDVEYFIASPTDTLRYTLRWGTDMINWADKLAQPEYQDLLHLQLPGDGAYYVAFFPRKRNTPAPAFSTLGDGTIIKVAGDFGKDYGFLSALEVTASGEGASFKGTAGSVQDRTSGRVLSLGAKGEVRYRSYTLAADFPASLRVQEKALTVELPASLQPPAFELAKPFPGGTLTVTAPGEWALAKVQAGVKLEKTAAGWSLTVPAGVRAVELISR
ncbi:MAG: hypothetical protein ACYC7E_16780 [Armatimonadota bacterium]